MEKDLLSIVHCFTPQIALKTQGWAGSKLGTRSFIWFFCMDTGHQALGPPSAAFPGASTRSWIRNLMWDVHVTSKGLIYYTTISALEVFSFSFPSPPPSSSSSSSSAPLLLLFDLLLYLKSRNRERSLFYVLLHFPKDHNSQDWARIKPGAWNSLLDRGSTTWAITLLPFQAH